MMLQSKCWIVYWVIWRMTIAHNPFNEAIQHKRSLQRLDHCFCELRGPVDECCCACDIETVDSLNSEKIHPLISVLVKHPYFKFYQVNLNQPCPFWPDDGSCVLKSCVVEECSEEEVPEFVKGKEMSGLHVMEFCDEEQQEEWKLSTVNITVSPEQQKDFELWEEYDDSEDGFCEADNDNDISEMSYVDLTLNPERYTGYSGPSSERIWRAIYQENCFRPEVESRHSSPLFESSLLQEMCLEKRVFFRILSGMHTSINVHLSAIHIVSGKYSSNPKFGPNLNEFVRRFDAATTNGHGPSWLKNLYFAYMLVLRAIIKMEPYWSAHQFYTGNNAEDAFVNEEVMLIIQAAKGCSNLFDETMMFTGNNSQLKSEFRAHFKNITRIMDCVGCDKCKLWGKLQVQGIGTALKILFSEKKNGMLIFSRREVVALFNVLGKFSSSIHYLRMFRRMESEKS